VRQREGRLRDRRIDGAQILVAGALEHLAGPGGKPSERRIGVGLQRILGRGRIGIEPVRRDRAVPQIALVIVLQHRFAREQNEARGEPAGEHQEQDRRDAQARAQRRPDQRGQRQVGDPASREAGDERQHRHVAHRRVVAETPRVRRKGRGGRDEQRAADDPGCKMPTRIAVGHRPRQLPRSPPPPGGAL
jgi:hypothetical protein